MTQDASELAVDLEDLVKRRTENAVWRSWSIEKSLNEVGGDRDGSGSSYWSSKPTPKAWELLHESFLLDVGDISLVRELSRRRHGIRDTPAPPFPKASDPSLEEGAP
ncbi:unnamed protein product, partial [Discosporangium mesarthrocarpum]